MSVATEYLERNERYAAEFEHSDLAMPPAEGVAVIACMDARLDVYRALGLDVGDAHVIRNAGGVVTEDVIRSLVISQRLLGTREIIVVNHTDCGMLTFRDDEVKDDINDAVGIRPPFALEAFPDPADNLRQSVARIQANPFLPHKDQVRGFVFEVETGKLQEVT